jgi:hypothetical protein
MPSVFRSESGIFGGTDAGGFNMATPWRNRFSASNFCVCAALIAALAVIVTEQCAAQAPASSQQAGITSTQTTYEPGDVYLPMSRVYMHVDKTGLGHEHGVVGQIKQGRINLGSSTDPGSLVFDMTSFTADTPESRKFVGLDGTTDESTQKQVNDNMRGASVLDVARFPTATFAIRQVEKLPQLSQAGKPQYKLTGDFSLHGVSRPIQVVAESDEQNGWIHLRGGFYLVQSQFGITPFTKAFGAVGVADQLSVWGDIWVAKQRQVAQVQTTVR